MEEPAKMIEAIERRWRSLTLANDFVFCKTMQDEELCRQVLEAILDVQVERVVYAGRQEVLDTAPDAKSVKLDVYVRDEKGTVYDVEMQSANTHELPQRSRYYQSMMALDQIQKGRPYSELKDSLVIFVCTFDPFGDGRRVYSFENRCEDNPRRRLGDGARTIFLSASVPRQEGDGRALDEFLDYVANGEVSGALSATLDDAVSKVLDNEQWRVEYMMLEVRDQLNYDKGVLKGREIGRIEGEAAGREIGRAEGEAAGREIGRAEGEAAGREIGRAEGEERLSSLIARLIAAGRSSDMERVLRDVQYREEAYTEFGI